MEYTFLNKKTNKVETHEMKISEYDAFKVSNPHLERYLESPPTVVYDGKSFTARQDNSWKEVLTKIGEKHPNSPLADQYVRKSTKEVKTREVLKKHREKVSKIGN